MFVLSWRPPDVVIRRRTLHSPPHCQARRGVASCRGTFSSASIFPAAGEFPARQEDFHHWTRGCPATLHASEMALSIGLPLHAGAATCHPLYCGCMCGWGCALCHADIVVHGRGYISPETPSPRGENPFVWYMKRSTVHTTSISSVRGH